MAVQVVTGSTQQSITFTQTATVGISSQPLTQSIPAGFNFANATGGALNVDTIHAKQYTLASTTVTLDLFGGSLLSPSGAACIFNRVRLFVVSVVDTTSTHLINVQSGASSGVLWLPPAANSLWATPNGGQLTLFDPNSITTAGYIVDTSHKNITFDSLSLTVIFNVLIVGNSSAA